MGRLVELARKIEKKTSVIVDKVCEPENAIPIACVVIGGAIASVSYVMGRNAGRDEGFYNGYSDGIERAPYIFASACEEDNKYIMFTPERDIAVFSADKHPNLVETYKAEFDGKVRRDYKDVIEALS